MEPPSVSSGPPVKRSFPVGTRATAREITHVCFFCGSIFPQGPDYQRHIVHEHQMASLAYQLWAEEHPPAHKGGKKEETPKKRVKEEYKEEKKEKRPKLDTSLASSLNTSTASVPSPLRTPPPMPMKTARAPPPITKQPVRRDETLTMKAPTMLPPGVMDHQSSPNLFLPRRYPANKQQRRPSLPYPPTPLAAPTPRQEAPSPVAQIWSSPSTSTSTDSNQCAICKVPFPNATALVVHNIREHAAIIQEIKILHHYDLETVAPNIEYEHTEKCELCNLHTPTLTKSFEHKILLHKGLLMRDTEANAVSYNVSFTTPEEVIFKVQIRLKRSASKPPTPVIG